MMVNNAPAIRTTKVLHDVLESKKVLGVWSLGEPRQKIGSKPNVDVAEHKWVDQLTQDTLVRKTVLQL